MRADTRHGTPDRPAQRRPLTERRQERTSNSRAAQAAHLREKLDRCVTPMDRLAVTVDALRTRLRQRLDDPERALKRARKAHKQQEVEAATARLTAARAEVEQVCERAVAYLAGLADDVDTARR